jgi:hypothetical protein
LTDLFIRETAEPIASTDWKQRLERLSAFDHYGDGRMGLVSRLVCEPGIFGLRPAIWGLTIL